MNTEDIYRYLKLQDTNTTFFITKIRELEEQIETMKNIEFIKNDIEVNLTKENYTKEEIILAYNRMSKYEGLNYQYNYRKTIVDTFIEFLNNTHHSLKPKENEK